MAGGAGPSETQRIGEPLAVGWGHPVGPSLAASYDDGGMAADPPTKNPVRVLLAMRPASEIAIIKVAITSAFSRCPPAILNIPQQP
jgi:hypothetical protein